MAIFEVDKLMAQTRQLAAEYYRTTGQTLPVSSELAKYDTMRLLNCETPDTLLKGVDAIEGEHKIQIKGRVIFDASKSNYRIGQINMAGDWDKIILVLFNAKYEPTDLFSCDRSVIEKAMHNPDKESAANKRGAMTIAKFKAISVLVWSANESARS